MLFFYLFFFDSRFFCFMRTHEKLSVEAWRAQHAVLIYVVDYTLFVYPFFAVLTTCYFVTSSGLRMFLFFLYLQRLCDVFFFFLFRLFYGYFCGFT